MPPSPSAAHDLDPREEIADLLAGFPSDSDEALDAARDRWAELSEEERSFHGMRLRVATFRLLDAQRLRMARLEQLGATVVNRLADLVDAAGGWDALVEAVRSARGAGTPVGTASTDAPLPEGAAAPEASPETPPLEGELLEGGNDSAPAPVAPVRRRGRFAGGRGNS